MLRAAKHLLGHYSSYIIEELQKLIFFKGFTFAKLTTPIAQGYSQIHGIIASICFNGWISTILYVEQGWNLTFLTVRTDHTL